MFLMADADSARDVEARAIDAGPTRVILVARTRHSTTKPKESIYLNTGLTRVLLAARTKESERRPTSQFTQAWGSYSCRMKEGVQFGMRVGSHVGPTRDKDHARSEGT